MERKDIIQGFLMQWALYSLVAYMVVIISNGIRLANTIVICALLSFLAAIVTTIIFLANDRRLAAK